MTHLFISDLHLEESRPDITAIFLQFLQEAKAAEALYILGDFFEIWIGDDDMTPFNRQIIQALHEATSQGLPIFMMHGNRDFLLGTQFLQASGCILLPEEHVINLYGTPILLMHGDTLCTEDKVYLNYRKKVRNYFLQKLFLWKSLAKRKALADQYRLKSKAHTSTTAEHIMDVTQEEVERKMQKHHAEYLIHGHTHRQAIHSFELNGSPATRIVLGPWHEQGNALVWEASGKKKFITPTVYKEE